MNIYDRAHELVKEIKATQEYIDYKKLLKEVESNDSLKIMIEDFHSKQLELQKDQILNDNVDEKKKAKLQELFQVLSKDAKALEFINAEMKFGQIMADISKILSEL